VDEGKPLEINPPPRRLPDGIRRRLKRDVLLPRLFGMLWFATGVVMLVVFLILGNPITDYRIRHNHATAAGTVTRIARAGTRNPYRVEYTFTTSDGAAHGGRSYTGKLRGLAVGSEVTVEYIPNDPSKSRIEGQRCSPIPPSTCLLGVFFLVAGGAIWLSGVVRLGRLRRLYEQGVATAGTVVSARWNKMMRIKAGPRTPRRFLYEVRYRFRDDRGLERQSAQRTYAVPGSLTFNEGDTVTVLYDRTDPARSLALDVLDAETAAEEKNK
jgi:hypothetical protein